mmetsp:Transcript_81188/g.181644  ORF Transcript_81188/g.181644 Transcript_81188/m.181644 type:complete len:229 (-) Transcript_81188:215-901(-)
MGNTVKAQVCCGLADRKQANPFEASASKHSRAHLAGASSAQAAQGIPQFGPAPGSSTSQYLSSSPSPAPSPNPSPPPSPRSPREDADKKVVDDINRLALRVETICQKFPSSGRRGHFGAGTKERYIAAMPAPDSSDIPGRREARMLHRWRRGYLGYWDNKEAFQKKLPAKGQLDLVNITKVQWNSKEREQVVVKHLDGHEACKLELLFPDERSAQQWRDALRHLRGLL